MTEDEEIRRAFLRESEDHLERLELDLVALEAAPQDAERLASIYRALHTIKGTSGFLGFDGIGRLAHEGEELLDAVRAGTADAGPASTQALLMLADDLRRRVARIERVGEDPDPVDPALLRRLAMSRGAASPAVAPESAAPAAPAARESEPGPAEPGPAEPVAAEPVAAATSIRVDAGLLDTLMDLAGELVLVRGRLAELAAGQPRGELVDTYRHLRRTTDELLDNVQRARLQTVGTVMRRAPRVARDLARELDRSVEVTLAGEGVGVDRAINEVLGDALVHLVRNAVDHGLEPAAQRTAAGKPAAGRIRITASQRNDRVQIEIADDGRGIDVDEVLERAVQHGMLDRVTAERMDPQARVDAVFLPGLSTRRRAGAISGRGVGMDAVRARLARIGGAVALRSTPGEGTTVTIEVPLTLAVVSCFVARAGGQRWCIPQPDAVEIVGLTEEMVARLGGALLLRDRGALTPLLDLSETLAAGGAAPALHGRTALLVQGEGRRVGLVVDEIAEPIEAVVKPLPPSLRSVGVFAGVTLLGDGRPTLVLETAELLRRVGPGIARQTVEEPAPATVEPAIDTRVTELLLARGHGGRRIALPSAQVVRLERAGHQRLREAAGRELLDGPAGLLPVVRLGAGPEDEELEVIVCESDGGPVGLVVESIDDVAPAQILIPAADGRDGIARVGDDVATLLDVEALHPGAGAAG